MKVKIGTIQEMTGEGHEILVDSATRSLVLARFFDGVLIGCAESSDTDGHQIGAEPTLNFAY